MLCCFVVCFAEVTTKLLHEVFNKQDRQRDDWFLLLFLTFVTDHLCSQWSAVDDFSEAALWSGGAALKQSFCIVVFCSRPSNTTQPEVSCWWWLRFWGYLLIWCYMTSRETPDTTSTCVSTVSTFNHLSGTFTFCSFCPGQREHTPSVSMKRWTKHQLHNSWTWVASDWDGVFL